MKIINQMSVFLFEMVNLSNKYRFGLRSGLAKDM